MPFNNVPLINRAVIDYSDFGSRSRIYWNRGQFILDELMNKNYLLHLRSTFIAISSQSDKAFDRCWW